jgi:1-phosphofructokinase family hexose kinase
VIIAAGLSPAWQTVMCFEKLVPGEVNRAREVHHFASGKVLNVAVALANLGSPSQAISIVGGAQRELIDCDLSALGVSRHWVLSGSPTRTCLTLIDESSGTTTELVENASSVTSDELEQFSALFAHETESASAVVVTGSLPSGTPDNYYERLLTDVKCPVILDARGPELLLTLKHRPWLVKPNRSELATTLGKSLDTDSDVHAAMQELVAQGAQRVLISNGAAPAWFLDGDNLYQFTPPRVAKVINPIGSGDCLAAGIAHALDQRRDPLECITFGLAAAAENVTMLTTGRFDETAVQVRRKDICIDRVRPELSDSMDSDHFDGLKPKAAAG